MNEEKIILPGSVEAATLRRVEGWVSREGRFYGKDEQAARWGGATHVRCQLCGKPTKKSWTACEECREKKAIAKYLKLPLVRWDESVPVYSPITGEYYWSRDYVRDENFEGIFDPISLQLVLCEPIYAGEVDPETFYEDLLPNEDTDPGIEPGSLLDEIFQELNDALRKAKIILSYEPVDIAAI